MLILLPISKAFSEIAFGVLLICRLIQWVAAGSRNDSPWSRPALRPLLIALAAFLLICALSITASRWPMLSLRGFIGKWLEYLVLFALAVDLGHRKGVPQRAMLALACSLVLVFIEIITQEFFDKGIFLGHGYGAYERATGPYENPSDLATYLIVVIPSLLCYAVSRRGWLRRGLLALVGTSVVMLARTDALGAWIGLFVGLGAVVLMFPRLRRYGALVVVGLMLAVWWMPPQREGHHGTAYRRETFNMNRLGTTDRVNMWRAAIRMIRDRPILGHGVNTFMANYLDYWVGGERQPRYAHNCYLQVAAETGLIGAACFLVFLSLLFMEMVVGLRAGLIEHPLWLSGFFAGLLGFAVQAAGDTNFYAMRQAVLFWTLAGLAVGLCHQPRPDPS